VNSESAVFNVLVSTHGKVGLRKHASERKRVYVVPRPVLEQQMKGKERKGKERKGKERKRKERKRKERKGKERKRRADGGAEKVKNQEED
jgi:hypothetical protein